MAPWRREDSPLDRSPFTSVRRTRATSSQTHGNVVCLQSLIAGTFATTRGSVRAERRTDRSAFPGGNSHPPCTRLKPPGPGHSCLENIFSTVKGAPLALGPPNGMKTRGRQVG